MWREFTGRQVLERELGWFVGELCLIVQVSAEITTPLKWWEMWRRVKSRFGGEWRGKGAGDILSGTAGAGRCRVKVFSRKEIRFLTIPVSEMGMRFIQ